MMEIMCRQKSCPGFLTSLERGYFLSHGQEFIFPHQPPSPASAENAPRFSATAMRLAAAGSRLPAGLSTTSLRCISKGAAKMEQKRAAAPQRHLFQGNTLSRAKGERAEVSGAFFILQFEHGSDAASGSVPSRQHERCLVPACGHCSPLLRGICPRPPQNPNDPCFPQVKHPSHSGRSRVRPTSPVRTEV